MGELDLEKAESVAEEILELINSDEVKNAKALEEEKDENQEETKWICTICGHVHYGVEPPEKCPVCGVEKELFKKA